MKAIASFRCLFFLKLFLLSTFTVLAQKTVPLKFEHYTGANTLAHGEVFGFMKDSKGFLWLGSTDGLNRYDGYEIKTFRFNPDDTNSVGRYWQMALAEDSNGIIWISGSASQGLSSYNPVSGKFMQYSGKQYFKKILPSAFITNIFVDERNTLWLSSDGLYHFDPATNKSVVYKHSLQDSFSISENDVGNICSAGNNQLYISVHGGFEIMDENSGNCKHFITSSSTNKKEEAVPYIFKDHKNNLWICSNEGLKMFDPASEKIITYHHDSNNPYSISNDSVFNLTETPDNRLWITTLNGMLNVFDLSTNKFFHYTINDDASENPVNLYPFYVYYDKSGKVWVYQSLKVNAVNLVPEKFKLFQHDSENKNSLSNNMIEYIYQDNNSVIFIGTLHGLNIFDPVSQTFKLYQPHPAINKLLAISDVKFIFEDKDGTYWMGINEQKLISYNEKSQKPMIYNYKEKHSADSLGVVGIYDGYQDEKGLIWFGGWEGLCSFNTVTNKFKTYTVKSEDGNVPYNNTISRILNLNDGKMWLIGTSISYYNPVEDKIFNVPFKDENKNIDAWNKGNYLCAVIENKNTIWSGTMGNGLYLLDLFNGRKRQFTTNDGLPSNLVWSASKDKRGKLWLATNNGLCRFTPPKNLFDINDKPVCRTYNLNDGLPGNECSWNSYLQLRDGTILIGMLSCTGLVSFHPDSLKDNTFIPPVYITGFSLFNKEVIPSDTNMFLHTTIETTKEIILNYKENVFSFTFAALSFVHPENNQYAYMLEGFDKKWIYTDASKRFANYTNLDAGDYIFKVKGSNNDGMWNEKPATLKLIITPPYWETWWFRFVVAFAVTGIVYNMYRFRLRQILKIQNIRNKISGDLHDDIGSTLNSISIYSQVAKNKSKEEIPELDLIGESSRKVMDAMSDIVWTINPENDSFEKIIFRMRSLTHQLLKAKKIEYTFDADESLNELKLPMQTRKNFYLIFKESLNNLVKYSNTTRASIILKQSKKEIVLIIRDNGIGFDSENPPRGNGLQNIKRRAAEIKADITIESEEGKGTSIILNLSL